MNTLNVMWLEGAAGMLGGSMAVTIIATAVLAPVIEEIIKSAGVVVMSAHHEMNDTLDGLLYGFVVGVGFSAVENWFY